MWKVEWIRVIRPFLTLCPPDYVLKVCWVFTFETDYYYICVECGGRAQCHGMCVEVQGQLWSHPLFRLYMGSRDQTQIIRLVQQVLLPAVHLDPFICFSNPPMNRPWTGDPEATSRSRKGCYWLLPGMVLDSTQGYYHSRQCHLGNGEAHSMN